MSNGGKRGGFTAAPSLIIGLGGAGLKVATFVKKNLIEINNNRLPPGMAILVLDTEETIRFQVSGWGKERSGPHATGPVKLMAGEYVPLTGNVRRLAEAIREEQIEAERSPHLRRQRAYRHLSGWFQARHYLDEIGVPDATWNLNVGAGRFRQFGRLALFSNIRTTTDMLLSALRSISKAGAGQVYVHITGSLAGGTGAALFIDVAHLVYQLAKIAGFKHPPVLLGHFILAEGFRGTREVNFSDPYIQADFEARCFAALRELTRLQGNTIP
ncbi:MAG TPA: hypothetical protein ENJ73_03430, partial [Desulfobacterales bacterium]|nr:hypothetical protein [Desulfobacterales bacterium]